MATFAVYELGGAKVSDLTVFEGVWHRRANEPGYGRVVVNGDVAAALLSPTSYVRVNDGTRDIAAFFPAAKPRRQVGRGSRVTLTGPGLAALWSRALVYPESDCRDVDVRWFGPMSKDYTPDAAWIDAVSHGMHRDVPFTEDHGPGFADRTAHLVSCTTSQSLTDEQFAHRVQFELDEDTMVVIQAFGDDFYRTWLDAAPLEGLRTSERPFNFRSVQEWSGKLCAGVHTLYFEVGNIDRTSVGNTDANPVYIAWSVMPAAGDGKPQASHQAANITHNHTGGTWYGIFDGRPTADIAWDATIGEVEDAFNDVAGEGEITVTGSPGAYVVTADGPTVGYTPHAISADDAMASGGTLSVTVASYGSSAEYIAHSAPGNGVVLPPGSGVKGMDAHEIFTVIRAEEMARGDTLVEHLQLTSTSPGVDTAGNTLPEHVIEIPLENGSGLRVWEILVEAGVLLDVSPAGVQQIWAPKGRGADRTGTVVYTVGDGSTIAEAGYDLTSLANVLRYVTETGWDETTDAPSIAVHGRAGQVIRLDQYDEGGADQFTGPLLDDLKDPLDPPTLEVPASHDLVPGDDYDLGDLVTMPAWGDTGFVASPIRVVELAGRKTGRTHVWTVRGIS